MSPQEAKKYIERSKAELERDIDEAHEFHSDNVKHAQRKCTHDLPENVGHRSRLNCLACGASVETKDRP